ncbi:MAG: serine/threonine-protein kinase [Planctomycetota bacterium]
MRESETLPRGILIHERFRLGAMRARGGMATIYEGTEIPTDRHVAIKFLRSDLAKNPDMVNMFRAEAAIVTKLDHPNLIRGLASGVHGSSHYIVMEFVSGPTLRERLKWGQPERDEALSILRQAAAGLDHAHDRGVVHRDIKPDNFILDKSIVRLGDFGIAQIGRKDPVSKDSSALGGTVIYSAPEQFTEGGVIDRRSDVYSLGIVAYEIFTNRTPFTGYKPASTISHRVPRAADAVLERAFHENPEERFPTASAFVTALEATLKVFAPDSTPAPRLDLETPHQPMKAVPRSPAPGQMLDATPGTQRMLQEAKPRSAILPWLFLVAAVAAVGLIAAKVLGLGPFSKSSAVAPSRPARVRSSAARPRLEVQRPCVVGNFARDEAAPPAPARLLEDIVAISLSSPGDISGLEVRSVKLESRATRSCENTWQDTVHEFVAGEAVGTVLVFDGINTFPLPRVSVNRIDLKGGQPTRIHVELQNPDAVLDLDLASGQGTLTWALGKPQQGRCELLQAK